MQKLRLSSMESLHEVFPVPAPARAILFPYEEAAGRRKDRGPVVRELLPVIAKSFIDHFGAKSLRGKLL